MVTRESGNGGDGIPEEIDRATVRRVVEGFTGPAAGQVGFLAPDVVFHSTLEGRLDGRDAVIAAVARFEAATGGYRREVKDVIADGPILALRYEVSGTHDREYHGISPTGREISTEGLVFFRMRNGMAVEGWNLLDQHRRVSQMRSAEAPVARDPAPSPGIDPSCPPPSRSEVTALVREFFAQVWSPAGSPREVVSDSVVYHSPSFGGLLGAEDVARFNAAWWKTFPDQRLRLGEILVSGDRAATSYTATATDLGGFMGAAPTGRPVVFDGHVMFRVHCGRIVEVWSTLDYAAIHRQLAGDSR